MSTITVRCPSSVSRRAESLKTAQQSRAHSASQVAVGGIDSSRSAGAYHQLGEPDALTALTEEPRASEVGAVKLPVPNGRHAPAGCSVNLASVMPIQTGELPSLPGLVRVEVGGHAKVAVFSQGSLREVDSSFDELMRLPAAEMYSALETANREIDPAACSLLAPVESQEVWAAGVTYLQSRAARIEESSSSDAYARVYAAQRPELFFKSAGWRVVGHGGEIGARPDSTWTVPEPELAVLSNSRGEIVAFACANDMSSRSIEGENPLYLPQAKVYDRSCSIGPAAVLSTVADPSHAEIHMTITRNAKQVFAGTANVSQMVREPAELSAVLHSAYPLPEGAWLLTGTSLVPPPSYTAAAGDVIVIEIRTVGRLLNRVVLVPHSGAGAPPRRG